MEQIYVVDESGEIKELGRFRCGDECKELHQLLLKDLNLIPGDQIDTEDPPSWLLIKYEMPVINAGSGESGLSLDFLLADQNGVPTLVECKRIADSRSKKEVVSQILEYAASGRSYWDEAELLDSARKTAGGEAELAKSLENLKSGLSPQAFFSLVKQNLMNYRIRCILFLDESPLQLRNLVEFVNAQMTEVELLIVEARQYGPANSRIVVPWVFGFSEKAREAKRASKAAVASSSAEKTEEGFWNSAEIKLEGNQAFITRMRELISAVAQIPGCRLDWGAGCNVKIPSLIPKGTLASVQRDGILTLHLATWLPSQGMQLTGTQRKALDFFLSGLESLFGFAISDLQGRMTSRDLGIEKWLGKADALRDLIANVAAFAQQMEP